MKPIPISASRDCRRDEQDSSAGLGVNPAMVPPFPAGHFTIRLARLGALRAVSEAWLGSPSAAPRTSGCASHGPVELIPARRQTLWGPLAVANFALGGLGAGFYAIAPLLAGFGAPASLRVATWLGPLLVLAGFAAVGLEAGRPRRGHRLLARLRSSWMSREALLGGAFVASALVDLLTPGAVPRAVAVVTALGFALAQGYVVRHAWGVPAWNVPVMPALFLSSALVSGAGLAILVETISRRSVGAAPIGLTALLLVFSAVTWLAYVTWSPDEVFLRPTRPLREGASGARIVGAGYVAPFVVLVLAIVFHGVPAAGTALAGALVVAMQVYAKSLLILRVAELRPITLAGLAPGRRAR